VDGWINDGMLAVGDDIMKIVVAGDIREHVFGALQRLVGIVKSEVVTESEFR
jgi:molybdopterin synthase catalytic subunit